MTLPATRTGVIAKKLGMTRFFDELGQHVPVTVLTLDGCQVVGHRTQDNDGYVALTLGAGSKKAKNTSKAARGHFAKANVEPKRVVAEFRVNEAALIEIGAEITGLRATHGVSLSHRSLGSTGNRQDPGKTFKNKKMTGHLGQELVTTLNVTVFRVDAERGLILLKGAVPGTEGTYVKIRDAIKSAAPAGIPTPGAFRKQGETPAAAEETVVAAAEEPIIETATAEAPAAEVSNEGGEA
jgi:large subunit ribosomal protein L3